MPTHRGITARRISSADMAKKNPTRVHRRKRRRIVKRAVRPDVMRQANKLYEGFTGEKLSGGKKVSRPKIPAVLVNMGKIDGVMYSAMRDGKVQRFVHEFKSKARPTFAVSPDGKQLFMLGGAYNFTERGIVDKR